MAFIIPNAVNTADKYVNLDQAEPDSLDFEVLGNVGNSGVVSGCAVTQGPSADTVAISAGTVVIQGAVYSVAAVNTLTVSPATSARFSVIVARIQTSSVATIVSIDGTDDPVNAMYPFSTSISTSGVVNLQTEVVLASIYRIVGQNFVTSGYILDKRVFLKSVVANQGTAAPTTILPAGTFYYSSAQSTGSQSGLYVSTGTTWTPIQQNLGVQTPVGAMFAWPTSAPIPNGFLLADGTVVSSTLWPELAAAYGETGATFTLPDMDGRFPLGAETSIGSTGGVSSVTLTLNELPTHDHSQGSHTHDLSGTITSGDTQANTTATKTGFAGRHKHFTALRQNDGRYFTESFSGTRWQRPGPAVMNPYDPLWPSSEQADHEHTIPTHTHSLAGVSFSGATQGPKVGAADTGPKGSGASFSVLNPYFKLKWIIKATSFDNYPVGSTTYAQSKAEVVTVRVSTGAMATGPNKAFFRMPWAATLTNVRASLNGTTDATSLITLDVNSDGATVLSTKLTIDNGESSSQTAAASPVISTSSIPDDAELSFDIDTGTGTGNLDVTLYFSRA